LLPAGAGGAGFLALGTREGRGKTQPRVSSDGAAGAPDDCRNRSGSRKRGLQIPLDDGRAIELHGFGQGILNGQLDDTDWLRQLLEWLHDLQNPVEFLEGLKTDLQTQHVYVFTPKGSLKVLPEGATPIDFAYAVHTDLGNTCIGAKVNNKMVKF